MDIFDRDKETDASAEERAESTGNSIEHELHEHFGSVKSATERQSILELTRELARLPLDQAAAALETSAAIAGVSLRASIEFLRAAPEAAQILEAAELRFWGDMGRRVAMGDVETAVSFFIAGVSELKDVPREARPLVFQVCSRQMTLSSTHATETLRWAPNLAKAINNSEIFASVFEIAAEISRRSARHSADFLNATPQVAAALKGLKDNPTVIREALSLASAFAMRAGGIASDAWAALPPAIDGIDAEGTIKLLQHLRRRNHARLAGSLRRLDRTLVDHRGTWQREFGGFRPQQSAVYSRDFRRGR